MLRLLSVGLVLSAVTSLMAQTVPITACGDSVPAGQTGVVMNDITCPTGTDVVTVGRRGKLDLGGFTLSGGDVGVSCDTRCAVSNGTIQGAAVGNISVVGTRGRLDIDGVSLVLGGSFGIVADATSGVVKGTGLSITASGTGIGITARTAKLTGLTVTGTYTALQVKTARLDGANIQNSAQYGIVALLARLLNSTVTGSGGGIDLFTQRAPRVSNTTCGVSRDYGNPTQTWGVCAND